MNNYKELMENIEPSTGDSAFVNAVIRRGAARGKYRSPMRQLAPLMTVIILVIGIGAAATLALRNNYFNAENNAGNAFTCSYTSLGTSVQTYGLFPELEAAIIAAVEKNEILIEKDTELTEGQRAEYERLIKDAVDIPYDENRVMITIFEGQVIAIGYEEAAFTHYGLNELREYVQKGETLYNTDVKQKHRTYYWGQTCYNTAYYRILNERVCSVCGYIFTAEENLEVSEWIVPLMDENVIRFTAPIADTDIISWFDDSVGSIGRVYVPVGTEVMAAADGKVLNAGIYGNILGQQLVIEHEGGFRTVYAHCSKLLVKAGDEVKRGDVIALSGKSGSVSEPQLRFEIKYGDQKLSGAYYLQPPDTEAPVLLIPFAFPVDGKVIEDGHWTGGYHGHTGLDIYAPEGTEVMAAGSGRVIFADWNSGYGNTIIIEHPDGYRTLYAHLGEMLVTAGSTVSRYDIIGLAGSTGMTEGGHVHFEVMLDGQRLNPYDYLTVYTSGSYNTVHLTSVSNAGQSFRARANELTEKTSTDNFWRFNTNSTEISFSLETAENYDVTVTLYDAETGTDIQECSFSAVYPEKKTGAAFTNLTSAKIYYIVVTGEYSDDFTLFITD